MGLLRSIANSIRESDDQRENIDDDRTTDRYLRSLRRHNRKINEEMEKIMLEKRIKGYEENRGEILEKLKDDRIKNLKEKIMQKRSILSKNSILGKGIL